METANGINAKGYLLGWTDAVVGMTTSDINATPENKWNESMGGCTRNCGELCADAINLLDWTAAKMRGEDINMSDTNNSEACSTKAGAAARLGESAEAFKAALASASDEALNAPVTAPFGMVMPLFMIATIAVSHVWYHDGQLNYVQCLLGDGEVHWNMG